MPWYTHNQIDYALSFYSGQECVVPIYSISKCWNLNKKEKKEKKVQGPPSGTIIILRHPLKSRPNNAIN